MNGTGGTEVEMTLIDRRPSNCSGGLIHSCYPLLSVVRMKNVGGPNNRTTSHRFPRRHCTVAVAHCRL